MTHTRRTTFNHFVWLWLATIGICALTALSALGNEHVQNGGFENGSLSFWQTNDCISLISVAAHAGTYAVQADPLDSMSYLSQRIDQTLVTGVVYKFSAWVKLAKHQWRCRCTYPAW